MHKILLAATLATGLLIAWIDSRPGWDDAGMTAFTLLLGAAIIGLFVRRRPWVFGLAIGLWLPFRGLLLAHDLRFLFVLLFPLAGVYAGFAIRRFSSGPGRTS
jgi:hypothetical protein